MYHTSSRIEQKAYKKKLALFGSLSKSSTPYPYRKIVSNIKSAIEVT